MFTGIVEVLGKITSIIPVDSSESGGGGWSMTISEASSILKDCHIGDSISVNGACLTVTWFDEDSFKVGIAPETLGRTDLGERKVGEYVNLERAVGADVRFGGHFVQGHIDDTATLISISPDDNSVRLLLQLPPPTPTRPSLLPSIIPKGFIALDGASLTITSVNDEERTFGVMLIAHTQTRITLGTKKVGSKVNVEVDMVGKYVEKAVVAALGGEEGGGGLRGLIEKVVEETLRKKGLV